MAQDFNFRYGRSTEEKAKQDHYRAYKHSVNSSASMRLAVAFGVAFIVFVLFTIYQYPTPICFWVNFFGYAFLITSLLFVIKALYHLIRSFFL